MLPLLPLIILIPFLAVIPMILYDESASHKILVLSSITVFLLVVLAVYMARLNQSLTFSIIYINSLNLSLDFQLTQLNLILVLMTSIVFLAASLVSDYFIREERRAYSILFAIAEGSSIALFLSANLFLFYVFWEISEVMMFFLIFIYGGYDRRYAALKFIIYSLASGLLLLIGIMLIYSSITPKSFDILSIAQNASTIPDITQFAIMVLFLIAFMIKTPVFPFHNWLPDAHTEAPTTGSMILAGVLLKFGGYGFLLLFLMIPIASHYGSYIAALFIFSAIYSSLVALRQTNIKRAIAYTSITDMGIVALGIAATNIFGNEGALYAMFSHGIAISLLFLIAGSIDELYGTLEIDRVRGIIRNFPGMTYLFIFGALAAIGMPLTSGFVGDLLLFIGAFGMFGMVGLLALASIIILGALMFWIIERMFLNREDTLPSRELDRSVAYVGVFLLVSTIVLGVFPSFLLSAFK